MKSVLTIFLNPDISMLILANQLPTSWILRPDHCAALSIFLLDILPFSFVVFILSTVTISELTKCHWNPMPSSVLPSTALAP